MCGAIDWYIAIGLASRHYGQRESPCARVHVCTIYIVCHVASREILLCRFVSEGRQADTCVGCHCRPEAALLSIPELKMPQGVTYAHPPRRQGVQRPRGTEGNTTKYSCVGHGPWATASLNPKFPTGYSDSNPSDTNSINGNINHLTLSHPAGRRCMHLKPIANARLTL